MCINLITIWTLKCLNNKDVITILKIFIGMVVYLMPKESLQSTIEFVPSLLSNLLYHSNLYVYLD